MDPQQQNQQRPATSLNEAFSNSPVSIGTPWRLFVFSVLLFAFSLLIYFGLKIGYENYLQGRSKALDQNLAQLSSSISQQDQQQFINIYSQIANLKSVLGDHLFTGNLFPFLEKNTLPQVSYSEAKFTSYTRVLELTGQAASLQVLAEQIAQFEKSPDLTSAVLSSMQFNPSGNTSFTITLTFNQSYLTKPAA